MFIISYIYNYIKYNNFMTNGACNADQLMYNGVEQYDVIRIYHNIIQTSSLVIILKETISIKFIKFRFKGLLQGTRIINMNYCSLCEW